MQLIRRGQFDLAAQQLPGLRVDGQVVPQSQRRAQHSKQPPAKAVFGEQGGVELIPSGVRVLGELNQGPQRGVGVRCAGQRPQQVDVCPVVVVGPTKLRQALSGRRVDQTEAADARLATFDRRFCHAQDGSAMRRSLRPADMDAR